MKGPLRGGMFSRHVKRHPGLVPLIGFISVGLGSAVLYLLRLALYSPDVSWDRKNNPEPWNKLSPTDQYKVSTGERGGWQCLCGGDTATFRAKHCVFLSKGKGGSVLEPSPQILVLKFGEGALCDTKSCSDTGRGGHHPCLTSLPSPVSGNFH
ncbi:NADH dehydrogenase [ubiquinone] 1 alpha subcomplex subunit 4-like 2 isoform 1-T1 [Acridotheres tristis]